MADSSFKDAIELCHYSAQVVTIKKIAYAIVGIPGVLIFNKYYRHGASYFQCFLLFAGVYSVAFACVKQSQYHLLNKSWVSYFTGNTPYIPGVFYAGNLLIFVQTQSISYGEKHTPGQECKALREMLGIKQEAMAYELGDDWM